MRRTGLNEHRRLASIHRLIILAALVAAFVVPGGAIAHVPGCNTDRCDRVAKRACLRSADCRHRVQRKQWHRIADPYWGIFNAISECESGGNWQINTGNGFYGGIQFTLQSWSGVGGRGRPDQASKLEQIYRGVLLMRLQGWGAWPVCRRAAGV